MKHPDLEVGDRVEAGEGEDFDQGRIVAINGKVATVAWDSGVRTQAFLEDLEPQRTFKL